jgi:hypothetical protein
MAAVAQTTDEHWHVSATLSGDETAVYDKLTFSTRAGAVAFVQARILLVTGKEYATPVLGCHMEGFGNNAESLFDINMWSASQWAAQQRVDAQRAENKAIVEAAEAAALVLAEAAAADKADLVAAIKEAAGEESLVAANPGTQIKLQFMHPYI